ncbi:MAG: SdpI family protein [Lachnospiraceae bacterium]|nr:SdpI family protein [Lachnospiraceae bacterium]
MGCWIFMLIMNLLIPAAMLGFGWVFLHKPPKTINWGYGYRTERSTKSQEAWDFAHQYAGTLWFKWGKWLLMLTIVAMLLVIGRDKDVIGTVGSVLCIIQLVPLIYVIVPTERALKRNFDSKGRPKKRLTADKDVADGTSTIRTEGCQGEA